MATERARCNFEFIGGPMDGQMMFLYEDTKEFEVPLHRVKSATEMLSAANVAPIHVGVYKRTWRDDDFHWFGPEDGGDDEC